MPSSIRTFVQWKDSTIFAGEDIECVITFKNVARTAAQRERDATEGKHGSRLDPLKPILERQRTVTQSTAFTKPSVARLPSIASGTTAPYEWGHKPNFSMGVGPSTPPLGTGGTSSGQNTISRPKAHGRSLSILSLGSEHPTPATVRGGARGPARGSHNRSASLQIVSRTPAQTSPTSGRKLSLSREEGPDTSANGSPQGPRRKSGVNTAPTTPALPQSGRSRSGTTSGEFRFPAQQTLREDEEEDEGVERPSFQRSASIRERTMSQLTSPISPGDTTGLQVPTLNPLARVLSETSLDGTPRTSSEFYAMSNNSDETVNSELPGHATAKPLPRQSLSRQASQRRSQRPDEPVHLMMGYAQTMGSFSLDGSLVNQAPFEEVKRKGVISSQGGGGVVGVERSKRESGLFGSFGWSNIGESLTGFLGMDEMSSMREMNRTAGMKTVPLLTTPQSILFVDLRLAPGESRSFSYRFKVPKGLPPSHKGRAIKVVYHLRLAVQRSGSVESQNIKDVEIPFRVLGSVDRDGEILGHDLMSPYVMLQDTAKTSSIPSSQDPLSNLTTTDLSTAAVPPAAGMDDFLRYTERLIAHQPDSSAPLISPTALTSERRFSADVLPQPKTQKDRIDLAILRSNQAPLASPDDTSPVHASNRFTIARGGHHVGVLTILRPAFRLGETVLLNISFAPPGPSLPVPGAEPQETVATAGAEVKPQQTYLVTVTLETSEKVDPSLALRSATSINRVTRKVHASATETVLFARQVAFGLEIPATATPSLETTGVRLGWRVRVEFTTSILERKKSSVGQIDVAGRLGLGLEEGDEGEDEGGEDGGTDEQGESKSMLQEKVDSADIESQERVLSTGREVGDAASQGDAEEWRSDSWLTAENLLENVSSDDRGRILVAKEKLAAETFEVNVPIKVYGVKGVEGGGSGAAISDIMEI